MKAFLLAALAATLLASSAAADQIVFWGAPDTEQTTPISTPAEPDDLLTNTFAKPPAPASEPAACYWPPHSSTWTFPGRTRQDLIGHLLGGNHGFTLSQLEGKTFAQLNAIHSSDHEHKLDRTRLTATQPAVNAPPAQQWSTESTGWDVLASTASTGSCPGGSCPLNYGPAANGSRRYATADGQRAYIGRRVARRVARPFRFVGRLFGRRCR